MTTTNYSMGTIEDWKKSKVDYWYDDDFLILAEKGDALNINSKTKQVTVDYAIRNLRGMSTFEAFIALYTSKTI